MALGVPILKHFKVCCMAHGHVTCIIHSELQIRGGIKDNSKIILLISQ